MGIDMCLRGAKLIDSLFGALCSMRGHRVCVCDTHAMVIGRVNWTGFTIHGSDSGVQTPS